MALGTSWHRGNFLAVGAFSSVATTGPDIESRVSCDRVPVKMAAYKGKCGAHSRVSMERVDFCKELGDHTTGYCQD